MELSLQKKVNYKSIREQRERMIREENLHILDKITYEEFLRLHQKYGNNIEPKEFARAFLDIDRDGYYSLQSLRREHAIILRKEFYDDNEFDEIRKKILQEEALIKDGRIDYKQLEELHAKYGGRFSIKQFAVEVLYMKESGLDEMSRLPNRKANILIEFDQTREQISEMIKAIRAANILVMGENISLTKFKEIFREYATNGITEKDFALRVLGIGWDSFGRFIRGKKNAVTVFKSFPIKANEIEELREKVITEERLQIGQHISEEDFERLYAKYSGILPRSIFSEEILDIGPENLRGYKNNRDNCVALTDIEISEEYIKCLKNKIIKENGIKPNNQLVTLEEIRELKNRYAPQIMSERTFVITILGIRREYYDQLRKGNREKVYIFPEPINENILELRQMIIKKEHLHYGDLIGYEEFERIREKYAPTMRRIDFARGIFDISKVNLATIKSLRGKTHILQNEVLPDEMEIERIRKKVVANKKVLETDKINYKQFCALYKKFGGIMPEDMFALQVMEISQRKLNKMKNDMQYEVDFLTFARQERRDAIKQKGEQEEQKSKKILETRVKDIMFACKSTPRAIEVVNTYIMECERLFELDKLDVHQLIILAEAISYIEADASHIEKFGRMCIEFEEYKFGSTCISRCLEYHENLDSEDRKKLTNLRDVMRHAVKKQKVVDMIARGEKNIERICYITGVLEVDVIEIMNRMNNKDKRGFPEAPGED